MMTNIWSLDGMILRIADNKVRDNVRARLWPARADEAKGP